MVGNSRTAARIGEVGAQYLQVLGLLVLQTRKLQGSPGDAEHLFSAAGEFQA